MRGVRARNPKRLIFWVSPTCGHTRKGGFKVKRRTQYGLVPLWEFKDFKAHLRSTAKAGAS